ncbi:MAG TPA: hypothetical protein PKX12_01815 [Spirochaetota bacterium]|nr:hypothetical protein [Spirochaetota bacterium]
MEFVILIGVNIAMFAIFYLIISLKLERSASEFREKRLRKVMDEIIKEFNETAERNISILENKISVMKRLMDASGSLKSIDISVMDEVDSNIEDKQKSMPHDQALPPVFNNLSGKKVSASAPRKTISPAERIGSRLSFLGHGLYNASCKISLKIREKLLSGRDYINENSSSRRNLSPVIPSSRSINISERESRFDYTIEERVIPVSSEDFTIEKEYTDIKDHLLAAEEPVEIDKMSERELAGLFTSSDDKYNLISDLFNEGYTVELLSRSSGIPVGEIRLVLNLNNS